MCTFHVSYPGKKETVTTETDILEFCLGSLTLEEEERQTTENFHTELCSSLLPLEKKSGSQTNHDEWLLDNFRLIRIFWPEVSQLQLSVKLHRAGRDPGQLFLFWVTGTWEWGGLITSWGSRADVWLGDPQPSSTPPALPGEGSEASCPGWSRMSHRALHT